MRIGVIGCTGRMGRANLRALLARDDVTLTGGACLADDPALGQDLGVLAGGTPTGLLAENDSAALIGRSDAVIEFSSPAASVAHAQLCAKAGCAHVIGTTGLDEAQRAALAAAAGQVPVVWAPNMSQGVNLVLDIVEQVARALDEQFDIEVVEMHHRHKVDAPSGTALAMGEAAARGRGIDLATMSDRGRDGVTGARAPGRIGFAALRGGDVVGDHTVVFAGEGERIEITHKASDRAIYARGAVRAACWAIGRTPGLYGMADVLGLTARSRA